MEYIMKKQYSVILAHPNSDSFNHAIARTVVEKLKQGDHEVHFHDLYLEKFDPILHREEIPQETHLPGLIKRHCEEIAAADGIVIVHPNWWGQPPAILKGWVDRVMRPGVAYEFLENDNGEGIPRGLLKAKIGCVFNTSNTAFEREQNVFGDPLEAIWKKCIFELCGVTNFYRKTYGIIVTSSYELRKQWLDEIERTIFEFIEL
jgi:NAD(P)H dehydrogenase (quinone)